MPLQSGSNAILKAMNRNYHREKYLSIIEALKSRVPDMAITTDIIVGFPGETEADFEQTLEVMDIVQFDNSYSFAFSPRPGTEAAGMQESLTQEQKLERLKILQAKQEEIMAKRLQAWVGREAEVLIDNRNLYREECLQGRISQGIVVNFERPYPQLALGSLTQVRITGQKRFTLVAEPV